MQSGWRERAGSGMLRMEKQQPKSTDWDMEQHGENARRRIVAAVVRAAMRTDRGRRESAWTDRAGGRRPSACTSDEASAAASRGAAPAFPSWLLSRSFRRSTPWRKRRSRRTLAAIAWPNVESLPAEMVMLARARRGAQICSLTMDVARLYELRPHETTQPSNSDFAQRPYGGRVRRSAVISKMNNGYPRPEPVLIKPTALAVQLGVSRTWIYDAARDGRIPSVRIGGPDGPLRFIPEDIEAWIDAARAAWRPRQPRGATLRGATRNGR
jgi:excisionase family DNA binding protein